MHISALEIVHVAMPLKYPWRTAHGEETNVGSILVRIEGDGESAWAESSPGALPTYCHEWAGGVFACLTQVFGPAIVGQRIDSAEELQSKLAHFAGNQFAKAAIDNAWWV